ncbi:MAG: peptidoglycan DD-metalloendopeptidase family protein [Gemmatimonadaceae bacterium]
MLLLSRVGLVALIVTPSVLACRGSRSIANLIDTPTPHERYAQSLREARLDSTALGREWIAAAELILRAPVQVEAPFREAVYLPANKASAAAYRFSARLGQRIEVRISLQSEGTLRLFLDLFELALDSVGSLDRVESREVIGTGLTPVRADEPELLWEPNRDATFVLRLQPELLRAGRYTVEIRSVATLAFPVSGKDSRAIQSRFGAQRDGGTREHQGVDIFAKRGTPVLAATDGVVRGAGTSNMGGNVVWLSDRSRGQSLYYAHLDTQLVSGGEMVRTGDTLGLVGNTGNARGTAPHLHFGIYRRGEGALDPFHFLIESRVQPAELRADTSLIGEWIRTSRSAVALRASPVQESPRVAELTRHAALRALAASGGWFRVEMPDSRVGYVPARYTEATNDPIRTSSVPTGLLLDAPLETALVVDSLSTATRLPVLAVFDDFLLVRSRDGALAWAASTLRR